MKFANMLSDEAVMAELGQRLARTRVERQMTQAQLAEAAGVSKRTVERLEDGASTQLANLIRCLRALDRLEALERLVPEMPTNPMDLLKRQRTPRTRARPSRTREAAPVAAGGKSGATSPGWTWGDET